VLSSADVAEVLGSAWLERGLSRAVDREGLAEDRGGWLAAGSLDDAELTLDRPAGREEAVARRLMPARLRRMIDGLAWAVDAVA
jgi:hypothetical protein